ncbi:GNAT family N-acetyltransferase [Acinetobacter sp. NCu2D-2]|uniref:GNAT family N-acetyltransferase n=1 Tax=Acinetobacter sp. NCu2D-2 TaxID=1608473 RepID=UPI0007CDC72C|nr:GNAT family N-acetyltransferase [Acinetobacter sp. NCu2D-2]ANF82222.1 GNAT family N-acetyltransferase [Acinetobacter sp. NCu2D-2]
MSFIIRPLNLDTDLLEIHQLTTQLGYPTSIANIKNRLQRIHQHDHYQTLVIEAQHKVVGYAGYIEQYTWEFDEGYFRIQALVINDQYRGQGLGKALIQAIQNLAQQRGLKRLLVNSGNRPERYPAHAFYKNLGFEEYSLGFTKYLNDQPE